MKKQQYMNTLETVVLRSPDKIQECPLQVKTINSSADSFQRFCFYFVFKNNYASLLSSETLGFFDYPIKQIYVQSQQQKIKRKIRDMFKVNNKDTTNISIVG